MSTRVLAKRVGELPAARVAETAFTILVIYLLSGGPLWAGDLTSEPPPGLASNEGELLGYFFLSGIYLVALVLTLRRPKAWWRATTSDLALLALLGLIVASTMWSAAPDVTLRRALALVGTSVFGIYLTVRYSPEEQLRLLGVALGFLALYTLFLAFTHPGLVSQREFRGAFDHKNNLGKIMALTTLVLICVARERRLRVMAAITAAVSFVLVVIAGSATGLVVLVTMLSLLPFLRLLKRDMRLLVAIGIAAILVLGIGILFAAPTISALTSILGRDATLTGRTALWPYVVEMIIRRPWLGYGYEAFWLWQGGLRASVDEAAGWMPAQAHNGFLDVSLNVGLIGLALFVFGLARAMARGAVWIRQQRTPASLWPLVFVCFMVLYNMTESTALTRNGIFWVLYVSALVSVSPKWTRFRGPVEQAGELATARQRHVLANGQGPIDPESIAARDGTTRYVPRAGSAP
jgi:O-antigen ligase